MPAKYTKYKNSLSLCVNDAAMAWGWRMQEKDLLVVQALFVMPRPQSHWSAAGDVKPRYADEYPAGRINDIDNLEKTLFDAITDSKVVWLDDSQVAGVRKSKVYEKWPDTACIMAQVRRADINEVWKMATDRGAEDQDWNKPNEYLF